MEIRPGVPFRGSAALAEGLLTRAVLFGPRFRRVLPDVHVTADADDDYGLLVRAALVLVGRRGALAGYSAAFALGASCEPRGAPAEVLLLDGYQRRPVPGLLVVRRDHVQPHEIGTAGGLRVTSPSRTAVHLARWAPDLREAVVAVDSLGFRQRVDPDVLLAEPPGLRGVARLPEVHRLVDVFAESPMESRMRVPIVLAGLPRPVSQHPVRIGGNDYRLDLAYPGLMLAIEFDGEHHRTAEQARADLAREQALAAAGWRILRFPAAMVLGRPDLVVARVRAELAARGALLAA